MSISSQPVRRACEPGDQTGHKRIDQTGRTVISNRRDTLMKYLLLLYSDPAVGPDYGSPEQQAEMAKWFSYSEELAATGSLLGGEGLQPVETASSVRIRDGKTITSDGPFAETKEVLGGFYLIDVEDLDQALHWAEKIPNVGYGTVEIRPIMDYSQT